MHRFTLKLAKKKPVLAGSMWNSNIFNALQHRCVFPSKKTGPIKSSRWSIARARASTRSFWKYYFFCFRQRSCDVSSDTSLRKFVRFSLCFAGRVTTTTMFWFDACSSFSILNGIIIFYLTFFASNLSNKLLKCLYRDKVCCRRSLFFPN